MSTTGLIGVLRSACQIGHTLPVILISRALRGCTTFINKHCCVGALAKAGNASCNRAIREPCFITST